MPRTKKKPIPKNRPLTLTAPRSAAQARSSEVSVGPARRHGIPLLPRMTQIPALCLFLALATAAVYAPVVRHEFIDYDDDVMVLVNPHVNTGLSWQNIRWALTADAVGNWHPLTWISHALDSQLYGLDNPGGHHATSLLLHVLNVVLLFLLLARSTGAKGRSFVVAALFALHPLNVESVAWVAERKNVLCTLFFLLALGAYGWYAQKPGVKRYLCVAALFALGLASKPMVITLPLVLLLLDFWPLGRVENWTSPSLTFPTARASFLHLVLEKLPLLTLSVASAVVTVVMQRRGNSIASISSFPLSLRLENAICSYATYLWKTFSPRGLAPFYPFTLMGGLQIAVASVFLLAVSLSVWKLSSGRPYLLMGYLWFLGTMVPVIGIVQVGSQAMADRYAYIPLIGIFVAVVWTVWDFAVSKKFDIRWLAAASSIVLVALSMITFRQLRYWKNSVDLWTHALKVTVDNYAAEEDLAVGLANLGRDDEAFRHFLIAAQIKPADPTARLNIAINLERQGRRGEAIRQFEYVVRISQDPAQLFRAHSRLGVIYAQLGDRGKARSNLIQANQLKPNDSNLLQNLSMLELDEAVDKMSESVAANPTAQGYLQLGQLLEQDRKLPDAQIAYQNALKLDSNLTEADQALRALKADNKP
jgi:tetratricopeptide (TPR) repeat protein